MLSTLFSAGYRPFFLLAALNAVGSMLPWLYLLWGGRVPTQGWPPPTLHAHEMLYGTVVPVIAGFLLTAVPNWTGTAPVRGVRLAGLVALWLAGRLALVLSGPLDRISVAAIDTAFLPVLAWFLARPIVGARQLRNLPVVGVLLGLAVANVAIHLGLMRADPALLRAGTVGAVYLVVLLMLIISGRVVPAFTRNALMRRGIEAEVASRAVVGGLAIAGAALAMALDLLRPGDRIAAGLALGTAPLLVMRASGWQLRRAASDPMLLILHVGHAWLAAGFACAGLSVLWRPFLGAAALHAFTAGAMGTLMLGMVCRVALGHGGRSIEASRATSLLFVLVVTGGLLRVLGAAGPPWLYRSGILLGGGLWSAAWLLYCVAYARILVSPRVDSA